MRIDVVGRTRLWLGISAALMVGGVLALALLRLDLSIDFVGGSSFRVEGITEQDVTAERLRTQVQAAGATDVVAQLKLDDGQPTGALIRTAAIEPGSEVESQVRQAIRQTTGAEEIQETFVGPTWGDQISRKALQALAVFLVVVVIYISLRLELKMAGAALVAVIHDILLTAGVYALVGFTVSPATVIAFLTILGYSLYDTVVIFDRVQENAPLLAARGQPGERLASAYPTYGDMVNASVNQVLVRSLNTSLTSVIPVGSLLLVGSRLLGATTLQDLALALFVGMAAGTYSSLFVASPVLAWWKSREPEMRRLSERAAKKGAAAQAAGGDADTAQRAAGSGEATRRR